MNNTFMEMPDSLDVEEKNGSTKLKILISPTGIVRWMTGLEQMAIDPFERLTINDPRRRISFRFARCIEQTTRPVVEYQSKSRRWELLLPVSSFGAVYMLYRGLFPAYEKFCVRDCRLDLEFETVPWQTLDWRHLDLEAINTQTGSSVDLYFGLSPIIS